MSPHRTEHDTEAKIKEAARRVFLQHGYGSARMRDIAQEAGINLALINYYFRSKEQLFLAIYQETFTQFVSQIVSVINKENSLEEKIYELADRYTELVISNPLAPQFIFSESTAGRNFLLEGMGMRDRILNSRLVQQLQSEATAGRIRPMHPLHLISTLMGAIVFPALAQLLYAQVFDMPSQAYVHFLQERKQLVPAIILAYLRQ